MPSEIRSPAHTRGHTQVANFSMPAIISSSVLLCWPKPTITWLMPIVTLMKLRRQQHNQPAFPV